MNVIELKNKRNHLIMMFMNIIKYIYIFYQKNNNFFSNLIQELTTFNSKKLPINSSLFFLQNLLNIIIKLLYIYWLVILILEFVFIVIFFIID